MSQLLTLQAIFLQIAEIKDVVCPIEITITYRRCRSEPNLDNEEGDQYTELVEETFDVPQGYELAVERLFAALSRSEIECGAPVPEEKVTVTPPVKDILITTEPYLQLPIIDEFIIAGKAFVKTQAQVEIENGLSYASTAITKALDLSYPLVLNSAGALVRLIPGPIAQAVSIAWESINYLYSNPIVRSLIDNWMSQLFEDGVDKVLEILLGAPDSGLKKCIKRILPPSTSPLNSNTIENIDPRARYLILEFLDTIDPFVSKRFGYGIVDRYELGFVGFGFAETGVTYHFNEQPITTRTQILPIPDRDYGDMVAHIYLYTGVGRVQISELRDASGGDPCPTTTSSPTFSSSFTPTPTATATPTPSPSPSPSPAPTPSPT